MSFYDIELAEPTATSRHFKVSADKSVLELMDSAPMLLNGNFTLHSPGSPNRMANWTLQEGPGVRTFFDAGQSRAGSGGSVRVEASGGGPSARLMQPFAVKPNGSILAECWVRAENLDLSQSGVDLRMQLNFDGMDNCDRWEAAPLGRRLCSGSQGKNCSFPWTRATSTCEGTGNHSSMELWLGFWQNSSTSGRAWITDCALQRSGGMGNILRRVGAPLTVRSASSDEAGAVYTEGQDYNPIPSTPQSAVNRTGDFPVNPPTVAVTLPPSTRMAAGEVVEVQYYYVPGGQVPACLTSPASEQFLVQSAQKHAEIFGERSQYLVRYDEIPQMHSCKLCAAKAPTAGQLLAWHANHSAAILAANAKPKRVMVWQDMFDPYANGNNSAYRYNANGITGAWKGLSRSWVIANWNHENTGYNATDGTCFQKGRCMTKSLRFFEGLGFSQFICGYYGSGNGTQSAIDELTAARGVSGLLGMIYGSWASGPVPGDQYLGGGDYSQLEEYAAAARRYWP